ncbi:MULTISPECIES: hypothetical protein [Lacticaseibacillus]|uniref:Uncharacterized protein n=2 Tax=Lacticaseibacillus TaxID=2759736 RepID=A0ABW4CJ75_9LACO|nr:MULTISPECIES: hypothetical protein [Lacticaseibacillus]
MSKRNDERMALVQDVLDRLCEKMRVHSSSLVYLDYDFTADEIDQLNQFMLGQTVAEHAVSVRTLGRLIQTVKPALDTDSGQLVAGRLIAAWLEEGMFQGILG